MKRSHSHFYINTDHLESYLQASKKATSSATLAIMFEKFRTWAAVNAPELRLTQTTGRDEVPFIQEARREGRINVARFQYFEDWADSCLAPKYQKLKRIPRAETKDATPERYSPELIAIPRRDGGQPPSLNSIQSHHPNLTWKTTGNSRFHFAATATRVFGRDKELAQLAAFCSTRPGFQWWGITGKGGSGKSRLALELAHQLSDSLHEPAWAWSFSQRGEKMSAYLRALVDGWCPEQPTLFVVDYVALADKAFGEALAACANNASRWDHAVRLLYIERTSDGKWYERMMSAISAEDRYRVLDSKYASIDLRLERLQVDASLALLRAALQRYQVADDRYSNEYLIDLLNKVDAENKPLYSLFLADAIASGNGKLDWDTDALIEHVLDQELRRWEQMGVSEADRKLLRLTTVVGALEFDEDVDFPAYVNDLLQDVGFFETDGKFNTRWTDLLQGEEISETLPQFEPDLLGELFVLQDWHPPKNKKQWDAGQWKEEFRVYWQSDDGYGLREYLLRTVLDFPEHQNLVRFIRATHETRPRTTACEIALGELYGELSFECAKNGKLLPDALPWQLMDALADLVESAQQAYSDTDDLLSAALAKYSIKSAAREVGDLLVQLSDRHERYGKLQRLHAVLCLQLTYICANQDELERAVEILDPVAELICEDPVTDKEIGYLATFDPDAESTEPDMTKEAHSRLVFELASALLGRWQEEAEFAYMQLFAAFRLVELHRKAGTKLQAVRLAELAAGHFDKWPWKAPIAEMYAQIAAMFCLDNHCTDFNNAVAWFEKIVDLAGRFPGSEQIAFFEMLTASLLYGQYTATHQAAERQKMVKILTEVAVKWPSSNRIGELARRLKISRRG
jgi:hypothetical protein